MMATDPLATLVRLRQAELDTARMAVGEALAAETSAEAARLAIDRDIGHETRIAAESDGDADVERFARWLTLARKRLRAAEQALADATELTSVRRAELALVRASAQSAEDALDRRRTHERRARERVEQHEQDEVGLRGRMRQG